MKKPLYVLVLQILFAMTSFAQQTILHFNEPQVCPETSFQIPLVAQNLENAAAITFFLTYDTSNLSFDSVADIHASFSEIKYHLSDKSSSKKTLAFSWYNIYGVSADSLALINLCFTHKNGASNLVFEAHCEIRDINLNRTKLVLLDAVISPAIEIQSQAKDTTVNYPDNASFRINASGAEEFQWLRSEDNGRTFAELENNNWIQGVDTDTLWLHHPGAVYDSNLFVCRLSKDGCVYISTPAMLKVLLPAAASFLVNFSAGWNGFSSFLHPQDFAIDSVFAAIKSSIIYITDGEDIYYPMGNINTLTDFNSTKAYLIKTSETENFTFQGFEMMDKTIELSEGWNLLPFLCDEPKPIQALESIFLEQLLVIKDASGINVYWPEKNISTLQTLEPGKAYQVKMSAASEIHFSNCGN